MLCQTKLQSRKENLYGIPVPGASVGEKRKSLTRQALTVLCCLLTVVTKAAPIATNTALPLSEGELIVRQQLVLARSSGSPGGIRADVERFESRTVFGYGVTSRLALFSVLPVAQINRAAGNVNDSEFGLGDAALFARYEVFRADKPGQTIRIAPYAGVRVPTGRDGKTGDGSVDFFGGIIATVASTQWVLDSQLRYDDNREADRFERGDSVSLESSFQLRLAPAQVVFDTRAFVFGVVEISATKSERNRVGSVIDPNSGGFQLSVTPGVQYSTRRWIADFGVKLPLVSDLNGSALESDYAVLTSIRINF